MSERELEVLGHIERRMFYDFVWSIPAEVLAERMHVSVESIWQSCANRGVPIPDEGYWMKVAAGMHPERPPLTEHRPGPQGNTETLDEKLESVSKEDEILESIENALGKGTVELIARAARGIVVDPDADLRPHLRLQRDACRSERELERWLASNEPPIGYLWRDAAPSSVARMCAILEAMGRAVETLGGTFDERGFDVFGERVYVSFSEHKGKYRKGQTPARTYNGLLSMYVGTCVYKDYREKNLEKEVPSAFANVCISAALRVADRKRALDELAKTRARYAERQASIAVENERRKTFNREVDRYERVLELAREHDRAESLRRYADSLEAAGRRDEADWVRGKADWADPVTSAFDDVFGDGGASDGSVPQRLPQVPYETRGIEADGFFGMPIGDPSPTLEAFKAILEDHTRRSADGNA